MHDGVGGYEGGVGAGGEKRYTDSPHTVECHVMWVGVRQSDHGFKKTFCFFHVINTLECHVMWVGVRQSDHDDASAEAVAKVDALRHLAAHYTEQ